MAAGFHNRRGQPVGVVPHLYTGCARRRARVIIRRSHPWKPRSLEGAAAGGKGPASDRGLHRRRRCSTIGLLP